MHAKETNAGRKRPKGISIYKQVEETSTYSNRTDDGPKVITERAIKQRIKKEKRCNTTKNLSEWSETTITIDHREESS